MSEHAERVLAALTSHPKRAMEIAVETGLSQGRVGAQLKVSRGMGLAEYRPPTNKEFGGDWVRVD